MAESGLGGRFWFKAAFAGNDARNVTYKQRLGQTPYSCIYGELKDVSHVRAFGCRAWVYLNAERREKGQHTPRAQEAIYLRFEPNTSSWSFFIPERQTLWPTNQAQFDEHVFSFRKRSIVDKFQRDNSVDIFFQAPSNIKWTTYNRLHVSNYTKIHYDTVSDIMVMRVNSAPETYVRVTQKQYDMEMLDLLKVAAAEHYAHLAAALHRTLRGLDPEINPDRPPKNCKDAVSRKDRGGGNDEGVSRVPRYESPGYGQIAKRSKAS